MAALPEIGGVLTTAVVHSSTKAGRDIGALTGQGPTGVLATHDLSAALSAGEMDVLLYAGLVGEHHEHVMTECAAAGIDQVHACFVDPASSIIPDVRDRIETSARLSGARIVGTGMVPGLWFDVLPTLLSSGLPAPVSIRVERISDISSWGTEVLRQEFGVGTTASGRSARADSVLRDSARLVAGVLGLDRELTSQGRPITADDDTRIGGILVRRGEVAGFDQSVVLVDEGAERLRLTWRGLAGPGPDEAPADVVVSLTGGDGTEITARVAAPLDPYPGTAARMLQAVRGLHALPPGLHPPTHLSLG